MFVIGTEVTHVVFVGGDILVGGRKGIEEEGGGEEGEEDEGEEEAIDDGEGEVNGLDSPW